MKTQNYLLLLFLITSVLSINAQDKSDIGLNFSSNFTFRTLKTNDTDFQWLIDHRNEDEQAKFGFNIGGTYSYQFDKGLTILIGIQYTRFGNRRSNILFQGPEINGIGSFQNSYGYVGVPPFVIKIISITHCKGHSYVSIAVLKRSYSIDLWTLK